MPHSITDGADYTPPICRVWVAFGISSAGLSCCRSCPWISQRRFVPVGTLAAVKVPPYPCQNSWRYIAGEAYPTPVSYTHLDVYKRQEQMVFVLRVFPIPKRGKTPGKLSFLLIDEETAPIVRLIFGYALNGHGPNYIRRRLEEEKIPLPHMVEPGTGASQYPHQMGKERPGKRTVYVGLLRYQRPFDESRLHRGDCFPEKRLPLQNRHDWGKEAGGLDCGGGTA